MGIFKGREKNSLPPVQTVPSVWGKGHPFAELERYSPLSTAETRLYTALREAVPVIDAAIGKMVRLVGGFSVRCPQAGAQRTLSRFLDEVQAGPCSQGMESFLSAYLEQLLTYGTAVGEMIPTASGDGVAALYNASLDDVALRTGDSSMQVQVCRREAAGGLTPVPYPELVMVSALRPEPGRLYGTSVLKGLPFVSGILLKIFNSVGLNWERVGNVRFAVTYKPGPDAGERAYARDRAEQIAREWSDGMAAARCGEIRDFVAVGDVDIKVIGAENQLFDTNVPVRQLLEQLVSKLSIPPFLLGLSWSSTERMSSQQADILTSELEYFRRLLTPVIRRIARLYLEIQYGLDESVDVEWDNINLQDEVELAEARLKNAQAKELELKLLKEEANHV